MDFIKKYKMLIKNYTYLFLANTSQWLGRGKYYRKKLFSSQRILENNFPEQSAFYFLQVGANDGKSFDFLYSFVINRDCKGIVIEPIREYYIDLCENYNAYPAIIKINKAVSRTPGSSVIYKIDKDYMNLYPDWVKGIASFDINNLTRFKFIKREHILEERVTTEPLMNIFLESNFTKLDYFQVDTEGYDYHVVDMFDFSYLKPKMVKAEFVNLIPEEKEKMRKKLKNYGYYVFIEGLDIIGVDLKKVML